jgi:hypothetical protein
VTTEIMIVRDTDYKIIHGGPKSRWADNIKLDTKQSMQDSKLWKKCLTTGSSGGLCEYCVQHIGGITEGRTNSATWCYLYLS